MLLINRKLNKFMIFLLGCIFIFLGVVKGIDPFNTSLKIHEYLNLFHLDFLNGYSEVFSVALCSMEIFFGLLLVFRIFRKTSLIMLLIIMSAFTIITAILFFDPDSYITDFGCFGESVHFSQTEVFLKNVIILFVLIYCCISEFTMHNIHKTNTKKRDLLFAVYFIFGAVAFPVYSLDYLPPMDFLGYNIGANLIENKEFSIAGKRGDFLKDSILNCNNYKFAVINRKPFTVKEKQNFSDVENYCNRHKIECLELKSYLKLSEQKDIYAKYFVDDVTLKSVMRDNNGLILIKDGIIKGKWTLKHKIINKNIDVNIIKLIKRQKIKLYIYIVLVLIYLSLPVVCFAGKKNQ